MHRNDFGGLQCYPAKWLGKIISDYIHMPAAVSWIFETGKIKNGNSENFMCSKSNFSAYNSYWRRLKNVHSQPSFWQ